MQLGSNPFMGWRRIIWGCGWEGHIVLREEDHGWRRPLLSMAFREAMSTLPWWSCWVHLSSDMTCPSLGKHCGTGKGRGLNRKIILILFYFYTVEYWDNGNILKIWWKCFFLYGTNLPCWKLSVYLSVERMLLGTTLLGQGWSEYQSLIDNLQILVRPGETPWVWP